MIPAVTLNKDQFATAFPYHLIFDQTLRLRQYGRSVARLSPVQLREGILVTSAFRILYPRVSFTVDHIRRFINAIFILSVGPGETGDGDNAFSMKGQMIWMADTQLMIFIGSPRLTSLKEMKRMNVYMADIPLYDVTREMVLLYQQRSAEIDITKELDETTAELKRMSRDLELEKQKTEKLLYQMLPEKVANQLKNGQEVEAEKFDQVTVLFSDIVNFTTIAAASSPLDVVNMLNDLYHRFDLQTNEYSVYKVETIGDAYMVVSGVPDITEKHSQRVANFALDMVSQACNVLCPHTGEPLQIRVGLHTGPVVAGVVGVKMPRYCLFGDTVNTASRMESNSVPGRIHVSQTTFEALRDHGFLFRSRGDVNIKGKGVMTTYFLVGRRGHALSEPDDQHARLPLLMADSDVDTGLHDLSVNGHRVNGYIHDLAGIERLQINNNSIDTQHKLHNSIDTQHKLHVSQSNRSLKDSNRVHEEESIFASRKSFNDVSTDLTRPHSTSGSRDALQAKSVPAQLTSSSPSGHNNIFSNTLSSGVEAKSRGNNETSRFDASIKNRRVKDDDVGRFPMYSKTCRIL
ncbi:guanylate cyclase soluble subunit beta-2-like [Physella acuta]|uniref:guanylate cyclase soluble subunit beta-2-like n=1 Tax=Physella acuta TaxID=109671 RepID=UPI0027DDDA9E|nr:guanylate cyclase soluble subunit beta-2-like [Physella acuta]